MGCLSISATAQQGSAHRLGTAVRTRTCRRSCRPSRGESISCPEPRRVYTPRAMPLAAADFGLGAVLTACRMVQSILVLRRSKMYFTGRGRDFPDGPHMLAEWSRIRPSECRVLRQLTVWFWLNPERRYADRAQSIALPDCWPLRRGLTTDGPSPSREL